MENASFLDTAPRTVEGVVVDVQDQKPWDRMENEPVEWYARFQHFLLQGRGRTVNDVYRGEAAGGHLKGQAGTPKALEGHAISLPGSWREAVKKFDWYGRASAYDLEQLDSEKRQVETNRAARRQEIIEQDWQVGLELVSLAREALRHGQKFMSRTVTQKPGKPELKLVKHPKTGKMVEMLHQVDREVVYIELKADSLTRMIDVGSKKQRQSVGLNDHKAQEAFILNRTTGEIMDIEAVDREIYQMFEELGANNYHPPALPSSTLDDDPPPGVLDVDGPPDDI